MLVRMAVLKGKDPQRLLEEMEVIDKQGIILFCFHLCQCRHSLCLCQDVKVCTTAVSSECCHQADHTDRSCEHITPSQLVSDADCHLCSSAAVLYVIPWTRNRLSDGSLDVAGLWTWNKLPVSVRLIKDFYWQVAMAT